MSRTKRATLGRPAGRTKAETRARIIDSAIRCYALHGCGGTTNRMIADGAGVTSGAIYRHFATQRDLLNAAYDEVIGKVSQRLQTAIIGTGSLREAILAASQVARTMNAEQPVLAYFLASVQRDVARDEDPSRLSVQPWVPILDAFDDVARTWSAEHGRRMGGTSFTEAMWAILSGAPLFALHSGSPERYAQLMETAERMIEMAAVQTHKNGSAVPGLDYSAADMLTNAAGG